MSPMTCAGLRPFKFTTASSWPICIDNPADAWPNGHHWIRSQLRCVGGNELEPRLLEMRKHHHHLWIHQHSRQMMCRKENALSKVKTGYNKLPERNRMLSD